MDEFESWRSRNLARTILAQVYAHVIQRQQENSEEAERRARPVYSGGPQRRHYSERRTSGLSLVGDSTVELIPDSTDSSDSSFLGEHSPHTAALMAPPYSMMVRNPSLFGTPTIAYYRNGLDEPRQILWWNTSALYLYQALPGTRTVTVVEKAQTLIVEDAGQQLTKLAPVLGVDERTMRWIGAEDLRFKSYVDCSKTVDGNCNLS
ncbi:unnamed protein product [Heligmosomoides polygyrus]|uniref:AMP_N domain-containing protein n=1 Tax=Heligmosomoides polygyrus TaxID=6339 RepID=A0A183FWZ2_HELPZ|nr:unnamed protein product [Heligmosomoides polygyrus]